MMGDNLDYDYGGEEGPEYSPVLSDIEETCPKQIVNSRLLAIKSEFSQNSDRSPSSARVNMIDDSVLMSQIPNQEFYLRLDKTLENLPKDLYTDEIMLQCNSDSKLINWYRQALADRARTLPECPASRLVTRRNTSKRNSAYKSAEDCYILKMFIDGDRSNEINNVFYTQSQQAATNDSVFYTPSPEDSSQSNGPSVGLSDKLSVPEMTTMLIQLQRDVRDLKKKREDDSALLTKIMSEMKSLAITTKVMYATVNSIRSTLMGVLASQYPGTDLEEELSRQPTETEPAVAANRVRPEQVTTFEKVSPQSAIVSSPDRSYRDVLTTANSQISITSTCTAAGTENKSLMQNKALIQNQNEKVGKSQTEIASNGERSKNTSLGNQSNQLPLRDRPTSGSNTLKTDVTDKNRMRQTTSRPSNIGTATVSNKSSVGQNNSSNRSNVSNDIGSSENPISVDNDQDLFVGVTRKKVASYYISNIDKRSTYSGFLKFLKIKGITPTQLRLFYQRNSIAAKMNISSACCSVVENEEFWPDEMKCRKWMGRTEWEKEQRERREAYEERRRARFYQEDIERKSRDMRDNVCSKSRHRYQGQEDNLNKDRISSRRHKNDEAYGDHDPWYDGESRNDVNDYYDRHDKYESRDDKYDGYDREYSGTSYWNEPE